MEHQIKQILLLNMPERDATALLPALVGPVIVLYVSTCKT